VRGHAQSRVALAAGECVQCSAAQAQLPQDRRRR
jgi:hypothetical protein